MSSIPSTPSFESVGHRFCIPLRIFGLAEYASSRPCKAVPGRSQLLLVWGGKGHLQFYEQPHEAARGFVALGRPSSQSIVLGPQSSLQGIYIEFVQFPSDERSCDSPEFELAQRCSTACIRLATELYAAWKEPSEQEPYRVQLLFSGLLSELHRELAVTRLPVEDWLAWAVKFVETHYREDLTREMMAERAGVSPEHFSRAFRKYTGRTFIDYLNLLRIRSAQCLVLTENCGMNALAHKVGFKDGLYLSRKFKTVVGNSPTVYRRKRKRVAALNLNHTAMLIALGQIPELGVYTSWTEKKMHARNPQSGTALNPYGHTPSSLYDAVAEARPDFIINYSSASENKKMLPLAPVIELPFRTMNWREQFRVIAEAINQRSEAERWLDCYDAQVERINKALGGNPGQRGSAIVWEIAEDRAFGCSGSYGRGAHILYDDLGFQPPDRQWLSQGYLETTIEDLALYPADFIFITGVPACPNSRRRLRHLFRSPRWLELEAVRNKRVYLFQDPDLFCGYDPISTQAQLNLLAQRLLPGHKFA